MARAQSPSLHYGTALVADIIARAQAEPPSASLRRLAYGWQKLPVPGASRMAPMHAAKDPAATKAL